MVLEIQDGALDPFVVRVYGSPDEVMDYVVNRRRVILTERFPKRGSDTDTLLGMEKEEKVQESLWYVLHEMRQGIYVLIRHGHVRLMAVVANAEYKDRVTASTLKFMSPVTDKEVDITQYRKLKDEIRPELKRETWLEGNRWWASHGILCQVNRAFGWGTGMVEDLLNDLRCVCSSYRISDQEFFINRRDIPLASTPQLDRHPYFFAGASFGTPYRMQLPVYGLYQGDEFSDKPLIVPMKRQKLRPVPWADRKPIAFFRGSLTGHGTTRETNVRLAVALESQTHEDEIDAGIIRLSQRDKVWDSMVRFDHPDHCPPLKKPIPMDAWTQWKYLIYCCGHSAALRLLPMLGMESVVIMVDGDTPCLVDQLWFSPQIKTTTVSELSELSGATTDAHVLRVRYDHLCEAVHFLRLRDDLALTLAVNAKKLYDRLEASRYDFMARQLGST